MRRHQPPVNHKESFPSNANAPACSSRTYRQVLLLFISSGPPTTSYHLWYRDVNTRNHQTREQRCSVRQRVSVSVSVGCVCGVRVMLCSVSGVCLQSRAANQSQRTYASDGTSNALPVRHTLARDLVFQAAVFWPVAMNAMREQHAASYVTHYHQRISTHLY